MWEMGIPYVGNGDPLCGNFDDALVHANDRGLIQLLLSHLQVRQAGKLRRGNLSPISHQPSHVYLE
jgi:hypothetical protein